MATDAAKQAMDNLRTASNFHWYVVTFLVIVMYIYAKEIRKAVEKDDWRIVFCGVTFFGMDLFNEIWNSLVFHFTDYAAFWMTPEDSAFIIMIGWNIEIAFMFSISGIVLGYSLFMEKGEKIGIGSIALNNRWAISIGFSAFAVFVELLLNAAGQLIWTYDFWNASIGGVWLIFLFGYLHFFVVSFWVHDMEKRSNQLKAIGFIYAIDIISLILFMGVLGWI